MREFPRLLGETKPAVVPKFEFLFDFASLGKIHVPENYKEYRFLDDFVEKYKKKLYHINDDFRSDNFRKSSTALNVGDIFKVEGYRQNTPFSSSTDWLNFIESKKGAFLGAQGLALFWEQCFKHVQSEAEYDHLSFVSIDKKEFLPKSNHDYRIPNITKNGKVCSVHLCSYNLGLSQNHILLLFKKVER